MAIGSGWKNDMSAELERLEAGDLDPSEARVLLREMIRTKGEEAAPEVYASLRSWTGRALRGSAGGEDLRRWYNLLRATAAQFRGGRAEFGVRIGVLGELVYERAGMAETRRPADILKRRHVPAMLTALVGAEGAVGRSKLGALLRLEQANLTRVCTMLLDAGLVARREEGRSVAFELTASGAALANTVVARTTRSSTSPATAAETEEWTTSERIEVAANGSTDEVDAFGRHDHSLPIAA